MCDAFFVSVPLFLGMRNDIEIPRLPSPCQGLCVYSCFPARLYESGGSHDRGLHLVIIAECKLSDLPESFQNGVTYVYYMHVGAEIGKESEQTFMKL